MKVKYIIKFVLITTIFLSLNTLAATNNKFININSEKVYCPTQVVCNKDNDIGSCLYETEMPQYWNSAKMGNKNEPTINGVYTLYSVLSFYHTRHYSGWGGGTRCAYFNISNGSRTEIVVDAKVGSVLEAYKNDSAWVIYQDNANCNNSNPALCPLTKQNALEVNNIDYDAINLSINGYVIAENILNADKSYSNDFRLLFDDVLNIRSCLSNGICKVDITSQDGVVLGSVIVDINNKMEIKQVMTSPSSPIIVNQIGTNSVAILKSDEISPFVKISNNLNSDITVNIDNIDSQSEKITIKPWNDSKLFLYTLYQNCKNKDFCSLSIRTTNDIVIGSVIIDVSNKIEILKYESQYPSEILITQNGSNEVDIGYSNNMRFGRDPSKNELNV